MRAIEAAFAEIATVHRLMSFHAHDSDLTRLNRDAAQNAVRSIDARAKCFRLALDFARASDGSFDPTVAAELVAWNLLPPPTDAPRHFRPRIGATSRSLRDGRIRFVRNRCGSISAASPKVTRSIAQSSDSRSGNHKRVRQCRR